MTPPPAATHAETPTPLGSPSLPLSAPSGLARGLFSQPGWQRLRLLSDVLALCLASSAALFGNATVRAEPVSHWLAAAFPIVVLALLYGRPAPDERPSGTVLETAASTLGNVSLAAMLTIAADSMLGGAHPVGLALRLWVFAGVYLGGARIVLQSVRRHAVRTERLATPTLIMGAGRVGEHVVRRLQGEPRHGLRPVGFLDADPLPRGGGVSAGLLPILGGPQDLRAALDRTGAKHLILAFSNESDEVYVETVRECERLGVEVSVVPRLYEAMNDHATLVHIGGLPLLSLHSVNPRGAQFAIKHGIDRGFSLLALVAAAPLMLAIAAAVRLSSPGPVFFRQRRVGRDGREFDVLKFRTMRPSLPEEEFSLPEGCAPGGIEGSDRRTGIGRYLRASSLDELPQLFNVLRGDMSLVGPRPERPEFVERFSAEISRYDDRHRVKSGITGWAQVHGLRGQTSIADRAEWDNHYIRNWSLGLDLRILALTVAEVLRFRDSHKLRKYGTSHPRLSQES